MAVNSVQPLAVINRNFKESLTCSICQDILRAPVYTVNQCQHVFCETCIREARLHGENCPNCREPIRGLMRSSFIENIIEIFYQMNPDIPRREPCEPWVDPPSQSPSRESDVIILNIRDNTDAHMLHMAQWARLYERALGHLYENRPETVDDGNRRSRRLRGLPPEVVAEPTDGDEDDEVLEAAVGPNIVPVGPNIVPDEQDEEELNEGSWIREVPVDRQLEVRPPPRRGRKRTRVDQDQPDRPEQPNRPVPGTSTAGNIPSSDVESRNCVIM